VKRKRLGNESAIGAERRQNGMSGHCQ